MSTSCTVLLDCDCRAREDVDRQMEKRMTDETETTPGPIDTDRLLTCIPDESSDGLPRQEIQDAYATGHPSFDEADFDAALHKLEADGHVRTTTHRISGVRVPYYRKSSR
jgi:hypothetical protein